MQIDTWRKTHKIDNNNYFKCFNLYGYISIVNKPNLKVVHVAIK